MVGPADDPEDTSSDAGIDAPAIDLTEDATAIDLTGEDDTAEQVYEQGEELLRQSRRLIDELDARIETWRD